jgi:hypothetical protein
LDEISKKRGFKTLDGYLAAAEKQLTPEARQKYLSMQQEFANKGADLDAAMKSALGMVAIGVDVGLTGFVINSR